MTRALRRAELSQRLGLDLADALASYIELLADFLERMLTLAADAEAQTDNFLLFRRERLEDVRGLVANVGIDHRIHRRSNPAVFDQIAECGLTIAADRRFERNRIA